MNNRVFILCAGESTRFGGRAKQLIKIAGEEILRRIIRFLKQDDRISEIFIITHRDDIRNNIKELNDNTIYFINPSKRRYTLESMLSTQDEWVDRNIILLGDVIFSKNGLEKILNSKKDFCFFGRTKPYKSTNKIEQEIYGIKIPFSEKERRIKGSLEAIENSMGKNKGKLNSLFSYLEKQEKSKGFFREKYWVEINDTTEDIDSKEDLEQFKKNIIDKNLLD